MKRRNLLLLMTVLLLCSGCSAGYDESTAEPGEAVEGSPGNAQEQKKDGTAEETEALAEGYRDLYEEAEEDGREDSLELKQAVVDYLRRGRIRSVGQRRSDQHGQLPAGRRVLQESAEERGCRAYAFFCPG